MPEEPKHRKGGSPTERHPLRDDGLGSPQSVGGKRQGGATPDGGRPPRTLVMQALNLPPMPPPGPARPVTPAAGSGPVQVPRAAPPAQNNARQSAHPQSNRWPEPQEIPVGGPDPRLAPPEPAGHGGGGGQGGRIPTPAASPPTQHAHHAPPQQPSTSGSYPPGSWPATGGPPPSGGARPTPHANVAARTYVPRKKVRPDVPKAVIEAVRVALPATRDPRLTLLREQASARDAAFRVLRHRVVDRGDPRSVLVTSAGDGEGKTTTALNLALALAESGRFKVLLIEVNVRRPAVAAVLGIQPPSCFLDQLAGHRQDINARWVVADLDPVGLHVLAISPKGDARALHGPTFNAAMDRLRGAYDYLVVDGSSILTGSETALIADSVDGLVFVARAHRARARQVRKALEMFSAADIVGTVLMDT